MHPRTRLLLALLIAIPLRGETQTTPKWFVSAGAGVQWGPYVVDQQSNASWDFDGGFGFRGAVERQLTPQFSAGLAFNRARLPLTYTNFGGGSCGRCAADATVSSYGILARYGGGGRQALHQVIEGFAGALRYGNFTQTQGGATLAPTSNTDLALGVGYGFGITIAPDWHLALVQDAVTAVHERSTLQQAGGRMVQHYMTRLTLRVGF